MSLAYSHELQAVPGFEVLPVGAVGNQLLVFEQQLRRPAATPDDFQAFAQYLGVDAVDQGSITDYDPYYPPRLTLKTNWYTANPNFHPVPVGYGLPWGTKHEGKIPDWVRLEAERELAAEQLVSQTPNAIVEQHANNSTSDTSKSLSLKSIDDSSSLQQASMKNETTDSDELVGTSAATRNATTSARVAIKSERITHAQVFDEESQPLAPSNSTPNANSGDEASAEEVLAPASGTDRRPMSPDRIATEQMVAPATRWPDPEGFIPPLPSATAPQPFNFAGPVIAHMATYNGTDEDFTSELEEYYYFRDDGRFGGWESYLQRSEDFIRFCCYLHIKQTLVGRGGQLKNRTVVRWPFSRYQER